LDERLASPQSGDEPQTIAGMLASKEDDPSTKAARQLDWNELVQELGHVAKEILKALANGHELTPLVQRLRRSRSSLQNDKMELAKLFRERLGENILIQVQETPGWQNNIGAMRERLACYRDRRCA
jgi:acyl-homoserine lactone acylase PvdQ